VDIAGTPEASFPPNKRRQAVHGLGGSSDQDSRALLFLGRQCQTYGMRCALHIRVFPAQRRR
jgi:hypothetical protein